MHSPSILLSQQDSILTISLNKPARRNAFDLDMRRSLAEAFFSARDMDDVKVVVLTGVGGSFCAGGDLKSLSQDRLSVMASRDRVRRLHPWFRELVNLEKPVIAAVEGSAYGAGFNLALAADFIVAGRTAKFCAAFGRIGLIPDLGGLYLLPRIVGLQRAKEIVFTARELDAMEAHGLGVVFSVHPEGAVLDEAMKLANRIATASIEAIGMAKNILNRSFNLDQDTLAELESYAQAAALHTEYHREAVSRFLDKKPFIFNWNSAR